MTLPVNKSNLQEFLIYLEKVYSLVLFEVLERFPEILTQEPELQCQLVGHGYLKIKEDGIYFNLEKILEVNSTIEGTNQDNENR